MTRPLLILGICRIASSCIGLVSRRPVDAARLSGSRVAAGTRPGRVGQRSQAYPRGGNSCIFLGIRLILHVLRCTRELRRGGTNHLVCAFECLLCYTMGKLLLPSPRKRRISSITLAYSPERCACFTRKSIKVYRFGRLSAVMAGL